MAFTAFTFPQPSSPLPGAAAAIGAASVVLLAGACLTAVIFGAGWHMPVLAAKVYLVIAILILRGLTAHPHRRFGAANVVTTLRAAVVAYVAAVMMTAGTYLAQPAMVWLTVGLAIGTLALDGVDGWLARRTGLASDYGARFDMETDAALILLLSVAAWVLGKAGVWVLGIGLLRYAFVAAQLVSRRMRAPLGPSLRRKAICVVQIAALSIAALPPVPAAVAATVAGIALALLVWSFSRDTWSLISRTGCPSRGSP